MTICNLLYQDNKSTILLAKNGRMLAGKGSRHRHIHHRFFLITDKIEKGDVTVEHRGTKEMWADSNTKALQGAGFRTFRSKIMGIPEHYDDDAERVRTHPLLLPKSQKAGVVPSKDLEVLGKTMGISEFPEGSTPQLTPAKVGRRSVLEEIKYGPGDRSYWEMKEGRAQSRYSELIRALAKEKDPRRRRLLFESHRLKIGSARGASRILSVWGQLIFFYCCYLCPRGMFLNGVDEIFTLSEDERLTLNIDEVMAVNVF